MRIIQEKVLVKRIIIMKVEGFHKFLSIILGQSYSRMLVNSFTYKESANHH